MGICRPSRAICRPTSPAPARRVSKVLSSSSEIDMAVVKAEILFGQIGGGGQQAIHIKAWPPLPG